ncbi:MAG: tRNA uridine-5-carboxymethylaminomethyl(34) synthesis GTPase MnmE, partial [Pseudomonadota bacterium]
MSSDETIAAISTPVGAGGIAIIRVSGTSSSKVAERIFRPAKSGFPLQSHRFYLGDIVESDQGLTVDQVLCVFMRSPATYTREDVVEFHSHGGPVVAGRILELALKAGARLAQPGEFTRRAFFSGRIDLSQAEAVAEIIAARSSTEAVLAAAGLKGGLRSRVEAMTRELVRVLAVLEAALDFPDEDLDIYHGPELAADLESRVLSDLNRLLAFYEQGRVYREG